MTSLDQAVAPPSQDVERLCFVGMYGNLIPAFETCPWAQCEERITFLKMTVLFLKDPER